MHNKKINELINRYIDNELAAEDRIKIEKHLRECGECRREYERLIKIQELSLLVKPLEPAPESLDELTLRIRRKIAQEQLNHKKRIPFFQFWPQVVSAAVILFVASIGLYIIFRSEEGRIITTRKIEEAETRPAPASPPPAENELTLKEKASPVVKSETRGKEVSPRTGVTKAVRPATPNLADKLERMKRPAEEFIPRGTGAATPPVYSSEAKTAYDEELLLTYDVAPQLIDSVEVKILADQDLRQLRREVTVNVVIDTFGNVIDANLIRSSGNLRQDSAILNSVRQYRFNPARYQNQRVKAQTQLRVWLRD